MHKTVEDLEVQLRDQNRHTNMWKEQCENHLSQIENMKIAHKKEIEGALINMSVSKQAPSNGMNDSYVDINRIIEI